MTDLPTLPEGWSKPERNDFEELWLSRGPRYQVVYLLDDGRVDVRWPVPLDDLLAVLNHLRALAARATDNGEGRNDG